MVATHPELPGGPDKRRFWSRPPGYLLLSCIVVPSLGILVWSSNPGGTEPGLRLFLISVLAILVVALCYLVRGIVYLTLSFRSRRFGVRELCLLLAPSLVVALTAVAWSTNLPMVVRWSVSAHAFDDSARQVRGGVAPRTFDGDWLGLYRIHRVERDNDGIYFMTGPSSDNCMDGSGGFAHLPGGPPEVGQYGHHLGGDWYHFCLDGGLVRVPDHPMTSR
ncbi:hypothetical protein [Nocardia sp. NBC_01329]|uniref:hypothetical protein n=1 Tax=Nocardia sp. NBC_01329 TaxID=2903594 RepID=UPI002E12333F|nr:hypothetical protein OG405_04285 [Nocardia sp. NBC_01329]